MDKTRTDFIRAKVEELKAFDIVHELRMINTEHQMGVPDVVPLDMVVEKLKPAFTALASAMEGLLVIVEDIEDIELKRNQDYQCELAEQRERPWKPMTLATAAPFVDRDSE